jgi:hypothetical protein
MFVGLATICSAATPCCPGPNLINTDGTPCNGFPDVGLHINCSNSDKFILDPNEPTNDTFTIDPTTGNLKLGTEIIQHDK